MLSMCWSHMSRIPRCLLRLPSIRHLSRIIGRRLPISRLRLHFWTTSIVGLWLRSCCGGVGRLLLGIGVLFGLGSAEGNAGFDVGVCGGVTGSCGRGVAGADEPEDCGG